MFTRDNPFPYADKKWIRNIEHNFEEMRQVVLQRGYDKVWCVESDTIPPIDGLSKLLQVDAPVVGGLYALRHGPPTASVHRYSETLNGIGGALPWDEVKANWGKVIQTSCTCTGCVVIDRSVLEGFSFALDGTRPPDGPFAEYCFHNKIKQMAHLGVICGHKRPNGEIIWPDVNEPRGWRIEKAN